MKKLLLSLATVAMMGGVAMAQDPAYKCYFDPTTTMQESVSAYDKTWTNVCDGNTYNIDSFNNNNRSASWTYVRAGSKNKTTVASIATAFAMEAKIDKVVINASSYDASLVNSVKLYISDTDQFTATTPSVDFGAYDSTAKTLTANIETPSADKYYKVELDLQQGSKNGFIQVESVEYYGVAVPKAVETPVITMDENYLVTISCATEDAEIYYTEDGSTPTKESLKYTRPFTAYYSCTYKAIAYKGEDASNVASFNAVVPFQLEGFGELLGFEGDADVIVNADMTVVFQNGQYLYVNAGGRWGNNMLVYGASQTFEPGDKFSTLKGHFTHHNGQPEITGAEFGEVTKGTALDPSPAEVDMVTTSSLYAYYKLEGVTLSDVSGRNATINQGGSTVALYNQFNSLVTLPEDLTKAYDITGIVSIYNTNVQFLPFEIAVSGAVVVEKCATPVITPNGGPLEVGAEITITCETEGATIFYSTDGSEPADGDRYTVPITFTEAMTLRAIAIDEEGEPAKEDSEIAEAVFTVKGEEPPYVPGTDAVFDFSSTEFLQSQGIELPAKSGEGTTLAGPNADEDATVSYTVDKVTISFTAPAGTQESSCPKLWAVNNSGETLYGIRAYAGNIVKFEAANGYVIQEIQFEQNAKDTRWGNACTYVPDTFDKDNKTWNAAAAEAVTMREAPAAAKTFTMTVGGSRTDFAKASVKYTVAAGVDGIITDANSEAVYYNLQGVRVANPEKGIYIRIQNGKSSKVAL